MKKYTIANPQTIEHGGVKLQKNPLTGDWFVYAPIGSTQPFICTTLRHAKNMASLYKHRKDGAA